VELLDTAWLSKVASILYDGPWVAERWSDLGDFVEANPGAVLPVTETILRQGANSSLTAAAAFSAMHQVQQARARCREQLRESVLILPTCGGTFSREEVRQDPIQTNSLMGLYTNHCNLCDLTALAIPTDQPGCDLPFGVTLFAPAQNQARLMAVANMLERV
jgi:allophanate hydrolase